MLLDDARPPAPDPSGRPEPVGYADLPGWCVVMARVAAVVVPTSVVPVCLLGALVSPAWAVLVLGPLVGAFAASVVLTAVPGQAISPRARWAALAFGVSGALAVPFTAGTSHLGGVGLALLLAVLVLAPFLVAERFVRFAAGVADLSLLTSTVPSLPTARLLDLWHATEDLLRTRPGARQRADVVRLRTVVLDELTGRDPAGVQRWVRAGDDCPERYIRVDLPR